MEQFRELVPTQCRDYLAIGVVAAGGIYVALKIVSKVSGYISRKRMLGRWKNTKKDVVILHRILPAVNCPNASPFVLKLETYLRMAKIPYEVDLKDGMGPKGKTPWITLNGEHVSDSQLCIEFLAKKFEKSFGNYSEEQKAVSTMVRLSLDEHFYWGLLMWRYYFSWDENLGPDKVMPTFFTPTAMLFFRPILKKMIHKNCFIQGMGRHSKEEVIKMTNDNLRAVSKILGNKKFILGDEPCEDDCSIFGELAQAVWCMPGSPSEKLINTELKNLKEYCIRMKETFWPDWEEQIIKQ